MSKNIKKTQRFALSAAAAMLLVGGVAQGATYNEGDTFESSSGLLHEDFNTKINVKDLSSGKINIDQDSNTHELNISVTEDGESALLKWNSFDIDSGATVNFINNGALGTDSNASVYVNILDDSGDDTDGATIAGAIKGINSPTVVIMDPNGITFKDGATVSGIPNFMVTTGDLPNIESADDFNDTQNILNNVYDSNPDEGTITIDGNLDMGTGAIRLAASDIQAQNGKVTADTIHITVREDSEINTSVNTINLSSIGKGLTVNNDKNVTLLDTIADNTSNLVINTDGNTLTVNGLETKNSTDVNLKSDSNITFAKKIDDSDLNINVATTTANRTIKIDENVTANSLNITTDNLTLDGNITTTKDILILTTSDDTNITLGGTAADSDNNLVLTADEIANVKSNIQFGTADKRINSLSIADTTDLSNSDVTIYTKDIKGTGKELDTKGLYIDTEGNIGQDQATSDTSNMFTIKTTGAVTILADQNISLYSKGDLNISTIEAADTVAIKSDGNIVDAGGDSNITANRLYLDVASAKYVGTTNNLLKLVGVEKAIEVKDNNLSGFHIESDKDIDLFHDLNVTNNSTGITLKTTGEIYTNRDHSAEVDLNNTAGENNQTLMSDSAITLTAKELNLAIDTTNHSIQADGTVTLNDTEGDLLLNTADEGENKISKNLLNSIDNNGRDLTITSAGKMTLDGNGTMDVTAFATTTLKANGDIDLAGQDNDDNISAKNLVLDGANITANADQTNVRISTTGDLTLKGASISAGDNDLNVTVDSDANGGSLYIDATKDAGDIKVYTGKNLTVADLDAKDGDTINISGDKNVTLTNVIDTDANLNLVAGQVLTTEAKITAGDVNLTGKDSTAGGANPSIKIRDDINATTMTIYAHDLLQVAANKTLTTREGDLSLSGQIIADDGALNPQYIDVDVAGKLNLDLLSGGGDASVYSAKDLTLGDITGDGNKINIKSAENLTATKDIEVTDTKTILNLEAKNITTDSITAKEITINAYDKLVVNDGKVLKTGDGDLNLTADSILDENNEDIQISVNGGTLKVDATAADGNVSISSDDYLKTTSIEAGDNDVITLNVKDVNFTDVVKAGTVDITAAILGFEKDINATTSDLSIDADKIVAKDTNIKLASAKNMELTADTIYADGGSLNVDTDGNQLAIDSTEAGDIAIKAVDDVNLTKLSNKAGDTATIDATGYTLTIGKAIDDEGKENITADLINVDADLKANTINLKTTATDIKTNNEAVISTTEGNLTLDSANKIDTKVSVADYLNVSANDTVDVSSDDDLKVGDVNDANKDRTFSSNGDITFTKDISLGTASTLKATAKNIAVDANISAKVVDLTANDTEDSKITTGDNGVITANNISLTAHILGTEDKNLKIDLDDGRDGDADNNNSVVTLHLGKISSSSEVNVTNINSATHLEIKTSDNDDTNDTANNLVFDKISSTDIASNNDWNTKVNDTNGAKDGDNDLALDAETLNAVPTLLTLEQVWNQTLLNKDAIDTLNTKVTTLEADVNDINAKLGEGFSSDDTVAKYIAKLAAGEDTLPALADISKAVTEADLEDYAKKADLDNYATQEALDNLTAEVNTNKDNIAANTDKIATNADNIAKIATIDGDSVVLTSAVDASNAKAKDEALGDLKDRVDTLEDNVTNVNNDVEEINNNESTLTKIYNFFSGLFNK